MRTHRQRHRTESTESPVQDEGKSPALAGISNVACYGSPSIISISGRELQVNKTTSMAATQLD